MKLKFCHTHISTFCCHCTLLLNSYSLYRTISQIPFFFGFGALSPADCGVCSEPCHIQTWILQSNLMDQLHQHSVSCSYVCYRPFTHLDSDCLYANGQVSPMLCISINGPGEPVQHSYSSGGSTVEAGVHAPPVKSPNFTSCALHTISHSPHCTLLLSPLC